MHPITVNPVKYPLLQIIKRTYFYGATDKKYNI